MEGIPPSLIEEWALAYLGRHATSAENLRRVLLRRARRRLGGGSAASDGGLREAIDALVDRYRAAGLVDDAAYAAAQARRGLARGRSARQITAGLAGKGVAADDTASALLALRETAADPELAAACAFAKRRRFGPFRDNTQAQDREKTLAAFARAGFSRSAAERVLGCADDAAVAALLSETARE
ncbi:MAG: hypothetical protein ACM3JG_14990 [Thiohalocapsa sp.]